MAFWLLFPLINNQYLGSIGIIIPPKEEQVAIVEFLDDKCKKIDDLISIKQDKIEKLNEYKKAVIFEYVTGKKRVVEE